MYESIFVNDVFSAGQSMNKALLSKYKNNLFSKYHGSLAAQKDEGVDPMEGFWNGMTLEILNVTF